MHIPSRPRYGSYIGLTGAWRTPELGGVDDFLKSCSAEYAVRLLAEAAEC